MKISELIEFKIDDDQKENFKRIMLKDNLSRGKVTAKILLVLQSILTLINVITCVLKVDNRFEFSYYFIMYMLMILVNIVYLLIINKHNDLDNKPLSYLNNLEKVIIFYVTFFMSWGSIISLMDQKLYGQVIVFMVNMIACSSFYYFETKKMTIPYIISTAILLLSLPFFQPSKDILIGHYVNVSIFLLISWLSSRILYHSYCSNFTNKVLLEKANNQLEKLSLIDELTGIPNRRSFNNYITTAYTYHFKSDFMFSIIMMDLDCFKQYNDNYGHTAGDKILKSIAYQINSVATLSMNFAARFGGEEFIYAAIGADEKEINLIAETIKTNIMNLKIPHQYSKVSKYISLSLGTSTVIANSKEDIFHCIEFADKALYLAKKDGRNCVKSINLTMNK